MCVLTEPAECCEAAIATLWSVAEEEAGEERGWEENMSFTALPAGENKKRCATVGIRAQEGGRRMALDTRETSESILKYFLHGFNVHTKIEGNNQDLY